MEKLYSSFGLNSDFFTFLRQSAQSSPQQKHVIIQIDEIHVKSYISDKEGKILGYNLDAEKTVFLSCTIKSCICHVEDCGLFVQIISTDNYPLNLKLFKLFSRTGKLETRVQHPCDIDRSLFLTFDCAYPKNYSQ